MRLSADKILIEGQWQSEKTLVIEAGKIAGVDNFCIASDLRLSGLLVPGFIDVQVNGGGGKLFNAEPTTEVIAQIMAAHLPFGTCAMLPTLITDQLAVMSKASDAIAQAIAESMPGIIGVHFEGPFLSEPRKGVHKATFIRPPEDAELALFCRKDLGTVMITVAPENFSPDIIRDLVKQGVIVSLGHSNASYEQAMSAIEAGATGFTHLYNAMSQLTSREPGMVGAALTSPDCYAGLVLDNHHVHPISSRLAIDVKGYQKTMLVTDAMAHVGASDNQYPFFDTVITRDNGKLTTPDGTLAGSCLDMTGAVKNAFECLDVPLSEAVAMASAVPAAFLGQQQVRGTITTGANADFVLLDEQTQVQQVYIAGQLKFNKR